MPDPHVITLTPALTPALERILGTLCFQAGPIAHAYQLAGRFVDADGAELRHRAEQEQAFIIHRMLLHFARHGEGWWDSFSAEAEEVFQEARRVATANAASPSQEGV